GRPTWSGGSTPTSIRRCGRPPSGPPAPRSPSSSPTDGWRPPATVSGSLSDPDSWRPASDAPAQEAEQLRLDVGALRWLDGSIEAAWGPEHGVEWPQAFVCVGRGLGVDRVVEAGGPGQVRGLHQDVDAQQPAYQHLERHVAERARHDLPGTVGVGQRRFDLGPGVRPAGHDVVVGSEGYGRRTGDGGDEPQGAADHVRDDIAACPSFARRGVVPGAGRNGLDPGAEIVGQGTEPL